jgi:TATA-binding protein-associated factor
MIPLLGSELAHNRQGSIECLSSIIDTLGIGIVPFIVLLIIPILGRMSDQVIDNGLAVPLPPLLAC